MRGTPTLAQLKLNITHVVWCRLHPWLISKLAKMHLKLPHPNGHSAYEDIQAGWEVSYQAKSYHNAEIIPG